MGVSAGSKSGEYWTQVIGNEEIYNTGGEGEMQARLQDQIVSR